MAVLSNFIKNLAVKEGTVSFSLYVLPSPQGSLTLHSAVPLTGIPIYTLLQRRAGSKNRPWRTQGVWPISPVSYKNVYVAVNFWLAKGPCSSMF